MRKLLLGLCIFTFSTAFAAQCRYLSFNDGYVSQRTFNKPQKQITYGDSYIDVEYKFDGLYLKQTPADEKNDYIRLYMDDAYYITDEVVITNQNVKRLPYYKDLLILQGSAEPSTAKIKILEETHFDYKCPLKEMESTELLNNDNFVTLDNDESKTFLPKANAIVVTKGSFRTIPLVSVNTYPIVYDSGTNTLRCYTKIKYRIEYRDLVSLDGKMKVTMTNMAYDVLERSASNPEMLKEYDLKNLKTEESERPFDYLIVTTDKYKEAAEKMSNWKTKLGHKCMTFSMKKWDGGHSGFVADTIQKWCYKTNFMPDYLLIIGSHNDVPSADQHIVSRISMSEDNRSEYFSDAPIARVSVKGSEDFDDYIKGRISVYTPEEAIKVVDKIIAYEQNPPENSSFYNKALTISYYETEGSPKNRESKTFDFVSSAEGFCTDLKTLGYDIDRHYITCKKGQRKYTENSQPQYFLNGDQMPEGMFMEDANGNDFWDKEPSRITNLINNGESIVIYDGHGNEGSYSFDTYTQEEVAKLKNGAKTPVFFNFTCSTGAFYYKKDGKEKDSLCFAEALLNKIDGGAVGVFANSNPTVHCESKIMGSSTLKELFRFPEISVATAIMQASFNTELGETRNIMHWFGDPSMKLYTAEPAKFKPFINRGKDNTLTINSHVKGSTITVCSIQDFGKSYYNSVKVTNEAQVVFKNVNVPCYVTITKENYVPYQTISKTDLYLQNMTLNGYHDIEAESITSGENVTEELENGKFIVESGETKLTASKKLSIKSGSSIKNGAVFSLKKSDLKSYNYKGDGNARQYDYPLCFNSLSERFTTNDIYNYEGGNYKNPTSVSETQSEGVSIYPNPTNGRINVVANGIINSVVVLDMTGNTLMTESANSNNASLDLSTLGKGMYLVKVVTADESIVKKVVLK